MPLSPAEQDELAFLEQHFAQKDEELAAQKQIDTYRRTFQEGRLKAGPGAEPTRRFSISRVVIGGVRDAIQGFTDAMDDLDRWSDNLVGLRHEDNPLAYRPELPNPEGSEEAGTAERLTRGLVSFAVPFTVAMKATAGLRAFGFAGRTWQGLVSGFAADFAQADPVAGNMANILKDTFGLDNAMLDSLAAEEDDSALMTRFKAAAAGAPLGLAGDMTFEAGARMLKAYRAWKGTKAEADAIVQSHREGAVKVDVPAVREPQAGARRVDEVEADEVIHPSDRTDAPEAEEFVYVPKRDGDIEDFDDVLDFLRAKAGDINMDEETFGRFARALMEGDPENALAKLGIDPLKIDFSKYQDSDMLARLQKGLAEVYESIAARLGRSNEVVSEKLILRGAEAMASTPDVLKTLYGSTNKLAEELTAARLFVGAHSIKLLQDAQAALRELQETGAGEAWQAFLESFHRHAYFMGMIRGAGSEVGRALRSLQILVKAGRKVAGKALDDASEADTVAGLKGANKRSVSEGATAYEANLVTDAEKIAALTKLIELKGDVSELSRAVREGNGSAWRRVSDMLGETVGSLFGLPTAAYNIAAGITFLSLNALGRLEAALVRSPMFLAGGRHAAEARRAWIEAWAYAEGILGGFGEATGNTLRLLEREALSEAAINLDGLGLTKLAKEASVRSSKASAEIGGPALTRVDVVNRKRFVMSAGEARALKELANQLPGPKFFQAGLRGMVNLVAAATNVAGSGFRLGTTLFINLPDEFVGTLGTRAGAYAEAVRIASREAAELELEGPALSEYMKARTIQLFGDGPKGWSAEGFDGGAQHAIARAGETEAKMVLFQDDPEWAFSKFAVWAGARAGGFGSLVVPFIRTPMKIIEVTSMDFNPVIGPFKGRIRKALAAGGSQRDEALARMSFGLQAVLFAYMLADDRRIVGDDGGYASTARAAGRPSYSLRIGDDVYEFSRVDPIGTLLGFGADLRAHLEAAEGDPEAQSRTLEMLEGMLWATTANMLSKTWLTSLRQLTDLLGATSEEDFDIRLDKVMATAATRLIPASGVQRAIEGWTDGLLREAAGFSDGLLKATVGADKLPVRRNFLGRPVEMSAAGRVAGLRADVMPFEPDDPVMAEMERLSFREPSGARRQKGVKLNATQFSRFLELRGQVVRDETNGLTMEEALKALVTMPEYRALPKAAQIAEIRKTTRDYSSLAAEALTDEDQGYALARLRQEVFELSAQEGWEPDQRDAELQRFAQQLGIPTQ